MKQQMRNNEFGYESIVMNEQRGTGGMSVPEQEV